MKFLVVLASIVLAIHATADKELWLQFKETYGRQYRNLREERERFSIFQDNLRTIEAHNEKYKKGESTYYMGVNKFSDWTDEEFENMLNYNAASKPVRQGPTVWHVESGNPLPSSVNWVSKGVVSEVKNQGECAACWAFSAVASLESAYALKTGNLVLFSEQNLVDCVTPNYGCGGGYTEYGFNFISENGIETESDYPYIEGEQSCQFNSSKSFITISGHVDVNRTESALEDAVANVGPISVDIDGRQMHFYSGGIFDSDACNWPVNHAVLVAGYGIQDGIEYWLVKNSFGPEWGENGYVRMVRNKNLCRIADFPSYPVV